MFKRLVCPLLLIASAAWGLPVCTTTTLNVYTNNDANNYSCTLGGLTFSDFLYKASNNLPAETTVEVTPVTDTAGDVGFIFQGAWTAGVGLSADAVLAYQITGATMTGASVALNSYGATGMGAGATIVEGICTAQPNSKGDCLPPSDAYTLSVYDDAGKSPVQSADVTFNATTTTLYVTKNIVEAGGQGSATISEFENLVETDGGRGGRSGGDATPEPGSLFTMGSGIIGACILLRCRRVKKV